MLVDYFPGQTNMALILWLKAHCPEVGTILGPIIYSHRQTLKLIVSLRIQAIYIFTVTDLNTKIIAFKC